MEQKAVITLDPQGWDTSHVLVDWLSVRKSHSGEYPALPVDKFMRLEHDGTVVYDVPASHNERGSYDSSALIRVTPSYVSLSFNPSKWNQPDNVFGLTWEQSLLQVDTILASLNLPPLGEEFEVTRIDLTLNISTGSAENLNAYYRALARQRLPHTKISVCENTLYWNKSSSWKTLKAYKKHLELLANSKAKDPDHVLRVAALSDWCKSLGVIRFEACYRRDLLRSKNLRMSKNITHAKLVELFKGDLSKMPQATKEITEAEHLSNAFRGTLTQWMCGYPPKEFLSKNSFYNHRRHILDATGLDISLPCPDDYKRLVEQAGRVIQTQAALPPAWYYQNLNSKKEV